MSRYRPSQFQRGDRDANEKEITAVLKTAGEPYMLLPTGCGADILGKSNPLYFIEVKSKDGKLTEVEKALRWHCEENGIEYYILRSAADAAAMLAGRMCDREITAPHGATTAKKG